MSQGRSTPRNLSSTLNPDPTATSTPDGIDSPVKDIYVSWEDYHRLIERLAVQIYQSGWTFNQIVCLAKGGVRVGDILARMFGCPLAILAVSSYGGKDNRQRGSITFSRDLTMTTPNLGSHILVVDDLVDSGITLERSLVWLDRHYGFYIEEMRTAVLWEKSTSVYQPHYAVEYLTQSPWIHQPFEPYERMTSEGWQDLLQNHGSEPRSGQSVL
jgi:hypoxanthine phosphoribosyltransferase